MSRDDYKVKVGETREIPGGEKQELELVKKSSNEVVITEQVSFQDRQLKQGYENRLQQWGNRHVDNLESSRPDHKGKEIEL